MRLLPILVLVACGPKSTTSDTSPLTGDTGTTTNGTGTGTGGTVTECTGTERLQGTVTDAAGTPQPDAEVRVCQGACLSPPVDADGTWCADPPDGWNAFEVLHPPGSGLITAYVPIDLTAGETRVLDTVLPPAGAPVAIPATSGEIEPAPGLFLTLDLTSLETPPFMDDATELVATRVDPAQFPPIDLPGTPLALWYVEPMDYAASPMLPMRFANDLGLADATTLDVYVGPYSVQEWIPSGTVTANGAWLEGDARMSMTGTVLLIQP